MVSGCNFIGIELIQDRYYIEILSDCMMRYNLLVIMLLLINDVWLNRWDHKNFDTASFQLIPENKRRKKLKGDRKNKKYSLLYTYIESCLEKIQVLGVCSWLHEEEIQFRCASGRDFHNVVKQFTRKLHFIRIGWLSANKRYYWHNFSKAYHWDRSSSLYSINMRRLKW